MAGFRIRPAVQADAAFLGEMVAEAANWRPGAARPKVQVLVDPDHRRYIAHWMRPGDVGFVAEDSDAAPIGAAWSRTFPRESGGYGYVAAGVPELIIGVRALWRSQGVGRALLRMLCDEARTRGCQRISLSVECGNFASTLYRSEGFSLASTVGGRDTMVKRLR